MTFPAHRNGDPRACGATTVVQGQGSVYVNGQLWAVDGDPNSHGHGELIAGHGLKIMIEGIPVIVHAPDSAQVDDAGHPPSQTKTDGGSGNVFAYKD